MAVVKALSNLIANYAIDYHGEDPEVARGRPIVATGTVTNAASDSLGSSYHLVDLPASCLIDPRTAFLVSGWGFAQVNIGTATDIDALTTVAKATNATVAPVVFGDATHGKRLWEVLGLPALPKEPMIGIYAHASAAATAAGSMKFAFHYLFR